MAVSMPEHRCLNCNSPAAGTYDLLVRGSQHEGVHLCEECYDAIQRETAA